MSSFVVLTTE